MIWDRLMGTNHPDYESRFGRCHLDAWLVLDR